MPSKTGQKSAITFGTTTALNSLKKTRLTEPNYEGDTFESGDLSLDPLACMPMEPSDLPKPGMIEVEFEADEALDESTFLLLKQTVTITYRPNPGQTNGATKVWANAFILSYNPGALETGGRRLSTISVQVTGYPTRTAGS